MLGFFKFQVLTAARFDTVDETTKLESIQGIVDSFIYIIVIVIPILQHELVWGTPHFSQYKPNLRRPPENIRQEASPPRWFLHNRRAYHFGINHMMTGYNHYALVGD
jgi:hypothetical protein